MKLTTTGDRCDTMATKQIENNGSKKELPLTRDVRLKVHNLTIKFQRKKSNCPSPVASSY